MLRRTTVRPEGGDHRTRDVWVGRDAFVQHAEKHTTGVRDTGGAGEDGDEGGVGEDVGYETAGESPVEQVQGLGCRLIGESGVDQLDVGGDGRSADRGGGLGGRRGKKGEEGERVGEVGGGGMRGEVGGGGE